MQGPSPRPTTPGGVRAIKGGISVRVPGLMTAVGWRRELWITKTCKIYGCDSARVIDRILCLQHIKNPPRGDFKLADGVSAVPTTFRSSKKLDSSFERTNHTAQGKIASL